MDNMHSAHSETMFARIIPGDVNRCRVDFLPWIRAIAPGRIPPGSAAEKAYFSNGEIAQDVLDKILARINTMERADAEHNQRYLKKILGAT